MLDFERPHYFAILLNPQKTNAERIKNELTSYNKNKKLNYSEPEIKPLSDTTALIYIDGFADKNASKDYLDEIETAKIVSKYENNISKFVISSDNFVILERSGNTTGYLDFYKRNYNDRLMYGK
jgi:hypothetical protein